MFHGKLSLGTGALGIEGFVHDGRTYTYFGLFPSIIRMPFLAVTSSLDGKLTASSVLFAWLLTGLFTSLLLWRVRFLVRGDAVMGQLEATRYGVLMATVMGGSVWMLVASVPYVFNEDLAWSICLTTGSLFMLLGVIERPSWRHVDRQRSPHPRCQPGPGDDWLGLRRRRRLIACWFLLVAEDVRTAGGSCRCSRQG